MKNKFKIVIIALIFLLIISSVIIIIERKNNKNKLLPSNISSINIEYYPFYNIETGEISNILEKQVINLTKDEINEIKNSIVKMHDDSKHFSMCKCAISDDYKMIVNNKYELLVGYNWGKYIYEDKNIIVNIADDVYNFVKSKVDENNEKISKKINANKIEIKNDTKVVILNEKTKNDFVNDFSYLKININHDYLTYDNGYVYEINIDDSKILYLYSGCVIGYLVDKDINISTFIHINGINNNYIDNILNNEIPDNYIAVFHGGAGEIVYETYIYKIDNGSANYGFKYINVTNTTESWGSTNCISKITSKGEFDWTSGAFNIAKENGAYSYVTLPNSNTIYTIDEFKDIFLMK